MPELERYMLHRLAVLDETVRQGYEAFDYKRIFARLFNFCTVELSALYFDIRKDALYCDPASSHTRRACRTVLDELFSCLTAWLAPMLAFTMEEVWLARFPSEDGSVHLRQFPDVPGAWRDDALAAKWDQGAPGAPGGHRRVWKSSDGKSALVLRWKLRLRFISPMRP